jgi:VWFA-related protein
MKGIFSISLNLALLSGLVLAQAQKKPQAEKIEDVIRITTELVQTDVVVTDKKDQIIGDLKLEDFELYDNGKKQDLHFLEFVSVETGKRVEAKTPATSPATEDVLVSGGPSAKELKRVIAFVVDDLTIPDTDMVTVRSILLEFVNGQMSEGDLVAVVRVGGGSGLLQQYTSDKNLLRRAISTLTPKQHPLASFDAPDVELDTVNTSDPTKRGLRAVMSLSTASMVIASLKPIPGRKTLVLLSGGLPVFEPADGGMMIATVSYLINELTDSASRAGVVINTMDVLGLKAARPMPGFQDTPAKSALGMGSVGGGGMDPAFGRTPVSSLLADKTPLDQLQGAQGLRTLANATGGLSSVYTNNFKEGLEKILSLSNDYYILAYRPSEKFDGKFHRLQIKVKREGARTFTRAGYLAKDDSKTVKPKTKQESIIATATSPLAKRDLDVSGTLQYKFLPSGRAELDVHLLIDAKTLNFTKSDLNSHQTSLDVVGFVFDEVGRNRGGFSETVSLNLGAADYQFSLTNGLSYSAHTELPPGYYQLRAVVRENPTGRLGSISRYLEVPDLANGRLTMSSLFLYGVEPSESGKPPDSMTALRQVSRKHELRYAVVIYNAKLQNGKPAVRSQLIITQNDKVMVQGPELPVESETAGPQLLKVGQLELSKVMPGRYVLTLVVTDPLADKKRGSVARRIDFTVVD